MASEVKIGNFKIGEGNPVYIIAEIGINHNGDLDTAKDMILSAKETGANAVKFQKRTPELCVPKDQRNIMRETPWGYITYMAYREKLEFHEDEYKEIDRYCKEIGIDWFVSVWDEPSVDFIKKFEPICYKLPSACLTDINLLKKVRATGKPMIVSTGMSTPEQIEAAVEAIGLDKLILLHSTSAYPCDPAELNLKVITTLMNKYDCPIGYSGHEVGLQITLAAVALGACMVERHITLDRTMWGTDQAASVEPQGMLRLVRDIRVIEAAMGDGVKRVYESELPVRKKLRGE